MSTEQYLANRMFGKRPEPRVGFREHMKGLWEDCGQGIAVSIVWVFICMNYYDEGKEIGQREALRQIAPISNSLPLMKQHLQEKGIYMFEEEELRELQGR